MKLTKLQRAAVGNAFREAKQYLAHDNRGAYRDGSTKICICYAIAKAVASGRCTGTASMNARSIVMSRLDGHGSILGWLRIQKGLGANAGVKVERDQARGGKKTQATRHAWLDSLIAEFS